MKVTVILHDDRQRLHHVRH